MKNIIFQIKNIINKIKNFLKLILINIIFIKMKIFALIYYTLSTIIYNIINKDTLKFNIKNIMNKIKNKYNNIKLFLFNITSVLDNKIKNRLSQDCIGKKIFRNIANIINFKPRRDIILLITLMTAIIYWSTIFWFTILELILALIIK